MDIKELAESFTNLCKVAYESWNMYFIMYGYKVNDKSGIWIKLGSSLQHYSILQIAKINDPKKHGNNYNLSLAYFVNCICKSSNREPYAKFLKDNKEFIDAIREARVKVIAHPDLQASTSNAIFGTFPEGLDEKYFNSLHEIISEGYGELGLGIFPEWSPFIVDDTKIFMSKIVKVFNTPNSHQT